MQMMTYRSHMLELTVIGDTINDRVALECWDLSPSGGLWFTITSDADGALLLVPATRAIPLDLLREVATVAQRELAE